MSFLKFWHSSSKDNNNKNNIISKNYNASNTEGDDVIDDGVTTKNVKVQRSGRAKKGKPRKGLDDAHPDFHNPYKRSVEQAKKENIENMGEEQPDNQNEKSEEAMYNDSIAEAGIEAFGRHLGITEQDIVKL